MWSDFVKVLGIAENNMPWKRLFCPDLNRDDKTGGFFVKSRGPVQRLQDFLCQSMTKLYHEKNGAVCSIPMVGGLVFRFNQIQRRITVLRIRDDDHMEVSCTVALDKEVDPLNGEELFTTTTATWERIFDPKNVSADVEQAVTDANAKYMAWAENLYRLDPRFLTGHTYGHLLLSEEGWTLLDPRAIIHNNRCCPSRLNVDLTTTSWDDPDVMPPYAVVFKPGGVPVDKEKREVNISRPLPYAGDQAPTGPAWANAVIAFLRTVFGPKKLPAILGMLRSVMQQGFPTVIVAKTGAQETAIVQLFKAVFGQQAVLQVEDGDEVPAQVYAETLLVCLPERNFAKLVEPFLPKSEAPPRPPKPVSSSLEGIKCKTRVSILVYPLGKFKKVKDDRAFTVQLDATDAPTNPFPTEGLNEFVNILKHLDKFLDELSSSMTGVAAVPAISVAAVPAIGVAAVPAIGVPMDPFSAERFVPEFFPVLVEERAFTGTRITEDDLENRLRPFCAERRVYPHPLKTYKKVARASSCKLGPRGDQKKAINFEGLFASLGIPIP